MAKIVKIDGSALDLHSGSEPPDNGDMEARVQKLEQFSQDTRERLIRIEAKQDEFIKHYATKSDLTEAKNKIIVWVVASIFLAQLLPVIGGLVKHYFP
ncbi:MAG: hypothetical protein Q4F13_02645 [Pseudomonadota bacterium]|nr:hypothetical protein [Pseudomonadota bacterium]